ncbi:MAG: hypothetical protein K9N46_11010 [Candidatus Marinimicrobia bacterium]|nr:hypothetical protein [Candidatus Neomarinimicrobiota bacterium]MCF7827689.1 hypothetical protein [Candidatus Neomarinimicrobiota bacterium]MCF7881256.1 hypothetical protein [Candidatus Neomarinimicrobiota bacterium]
MKRWILLFACGLLILNWPVSNSAQSMYSSTGFGDLTLPSTSRADGLGVNGVAMPDFQEISLINPAYWHYLDFTGITTQIQSSRVTNDAGGANNRSAFDGFNFHLPIGEHVGIALGFAPLSFVNYHYARQDSIPSLENPAENVGYSIDLTGSGGVGSNFIGFGWRISEKISIGTAYSLLVGQIDTRRTLEMQDPSYSSRYVNGSTNVYGGNIVLGAAYRSLITKSDNLGFRIELPLSLMLRKESEYYNGVNTPEVTTDEIEDILWPLEMSFGYQARLTGRWLGVAEVNYWHPTADLNAITSSNFSMNNDGLEIGGGIEYASDYEAEDWWQTLAFRSGIRWRQYLTSGGNGNQSIGLTWVGGIGVPFGESANRMDLSVSFARRNGYADTDPIETSVGFSLGITVSEPWFRGGIRNR